MNEFIEYDHCARGLMEVWRNVDTGKLFYKIIR